jgi:hypothetical protein
MRRGSGRGWIGSLALLALLAHSGCASIQETNRLEGIKTIGIVSAIGDKFTFTPSGLTGFDNAQHSVSIEAWGIDEQIVARATSVLGQRFQVQTLSYPREPFAAPERTSVIPAVDLLRENPFKREDPFKEKIRSHVSPQGLDAYVVITKATLKFGTRGVPVSGIGLIKHTTLLDSSAIVHALYVIRVVDGHTFRTIDTKSAAPVDNSGIVKLTGPSRPFDAAGLPPISDPLENESLKAAVADLINRSLEPTLRDLRLTAP